MGDMRASKMPKGKTITRKDDPDAVEMYAKGGKVDFIKSAIKKPGALRAALGAKPGKTIPADKLGKAAKAPGKLGQRARFAEMLKGFKKKSKD
jgi:hypothetical protein